MAAIIDATYQQSKRALVQTIAVALNIVLNLLVVKWAGIRGAAVNYVITVIILMVGYTAIVLSYRARHMPRPLNKRIILLNAHTYCNAGDAALIQVAIEQLNEHFPDSQVTLIANDPDSFPDQQNTLGSFFTWITQGSKWKLGRLAWLLPASLTPVLAYRILGSPWFGLTPKSLRQFLAGLSRERSGRQHPGRFLLPFGQRPDFTGHCLHPGPGDPGRQAALYFPAIDRPVQTWLGADSRQVVVFPGPGGNGARGRLA